MLHYKKKPFTTQLYTRLHLIIKGKITTTNVQTAVGRNALIPTITLIDIQHCVGVRTPQPTKNVSSLQTFTLFLHSTIIMLMKIYQKETHETHISTPNTHRRALRK